MRSRYTAYAAGDVRYIMATTHPDSPHRQSDVDAWTGELAAFCQQTDFLGLQVQSARAQGDQGWVQFVAQLSQGSQATEMQEHSYFLQVEGRWLYLSAVRPQE